MAKALGLPTDGTIEDVAARLLEEMCGDKDHHGHCVATILMTDGKEGVMLCQRVNATEVRVCQERKTRAGREVRSDESLRIRASTVLTQ